MSQGSGEVQQLFGLPESEELMEKFSCTLLQTVECRHNTFSKPQQVASWLPCILHPFTPTCDYLQYTHLGCKGVEQKIHTVF